MSNDNLERVGVRAVVENFNNFQRSIAVVRREIERTGKASKDAAKGYGKSAEGSEAFGKAVDKLIDFLKGYSKETEITVEKNDKFTKALARVNKEATATQKIITKSIATNEDYEEGVVSTTLKVAALWRTFNLVRSAASVFGFTLGASLLPILGKVAAGVGIAILAFKALKGTLDSVIQNAGSEGVVRAFNNLTQSVAVASDALFNDLRVAAKGTISDMQLLTSANEALAGATGETGKFFGESLPGLLRIARVQASATGKDIGFLFNSLVSGIKRSSPLLIDNTGLVLKVGEANEKYAESIGKTVDQLTAQERQIALLQATLEAGERSIEAIGDANETLAVKLARTQALFANIRDTIGIALQPLFRAFQDLVNVFVGELEEIVRAIAPFIRLFSLIGGKILEAITFPFRQLFKVIDFEEISRQFFLGGASILAAFTNAILFVANAALFPAIIGIATFIADFLSGQSPPPRGPLSMIDIGGAKVMEAWLTGFTGVSLDPVRKVAQDVQNVLVGTGIAGLSREAVQKRLSELDAALQPFIDKLDIIKSQFEELREPAEAALRAIDRQLNKAVQALLDGEEGSAEMVRQLDRQRAAIEGTLEAQQAQIDAAQVQLALKKNEQAVERTLLGIRLRQLGPEEKLTKEREKQAKAGAGAGEAPTLPEEAGLSAEALAGVEGTGIGLGGAGILGEAEQRFLSQTQGQRDLFETNRQALRQQFKRIGESNLVQNIVKPFTEIPQKITEALGDFGTFVDTTFVQPFRDVTSDIDALLFGEEDSLRTFLEGLPGRIETWLGEFITIPSISDAFESAVEDVNDFISGIGTKTVPSLKALLEGLPDNILIWLIGLPIKLTEELVGAFVGAIVSIGASLLDTDKPDALGYKIKQIITDIGDWLSELPQTLVNFLQGPFVDAIVAIADWISGAPEGALSLADRISNFFFGTGEGTLAGVLGGLGTTIFNILVKPIQDEVSEFISWMVDNTFVGGLAAKLFMFFQQGGEGTLSAMLSSGVQKFMDFISGVGDALRGFGLIVWATVVQPLIGALNWIVDRLNDFIAKIQGPINDVTDFLNIGAPEIGLIAKINDSPPAFLLSPPSLGGGGAGANIAEAALGGLFGPGLLRVGERGEELVASASKLAVFPNEFTRAIDNLSGIMSGMVGSAPSGGTTINNTTIDNSLTGNFSGGGSVSRNTFREFSSMRAFRR